MGLEEREEAVNINWTKAAVAGVVGTAVMTLVGLYVAPMMGIPKMNPAVMLAGAMGGNMALGWTGHLMIGVILAGIYALVAAKLPGPAWGRGALYGLAPWLAAEIVVIPMMGMPLFSGSAALAMGSLIGHLVYGGVVGAIYGLPARRGALAPAV